MEFISHFLLRAQSNITPLLLINVVHQYFDSNSNRVEGAVLSSDIRKNIFIRECSLIAVIFALSDLIPMCYSAKGCSRTSLLISHVLQLSAQLTVLILTFLYQWRWGALAFFALTHLFTVGRNTFTPLLIEEWYRPVAALGGAFSSFLTYCLIYPVRYFATAHELLILAAIQLATSTLITSTELILYKNHRLIELEQLHTAKELL